MTKSDQRKRKSLEKQAIERSSHSFDYGNTKSSARYWVHVFSVPSLAFKRALIATVVLTGDMVSPSEQKHGDEAKPTPIRQKRSKEGVRRNPAHPLVTI
jgi:hypothetical protein